MSVASDIAVERDGDVAWVTFDRPRARNAFTFAMYERLVALCDELEADDEVRVIVLAGRGDEAFSSGTDIAQLREVATAEAALAYEARLERAVARVETLARPTIALVRGVAAGGGAALALACDIRIGAPNARFGVPIARTVGNCLTLRNVSRLLEIAGPALAKDLLLTGRLMDAAEALRVGLFSEVVPLPRIAARVAALATELAANAPLTQRAAKVAVLRLLEARRELAGSGDDLVLLAYLSEDFREGVAAFAEKRPPAWRGR